MSAAARRLPRPRLERRRPRGASARGGRRARASTGSRSRRSPRCTRPSRSARSSTSPTSSTPRCGSAPRSSRRSCSTSARRSRSSRADVRRPAARPAAARRRRAAARRRGAGTERLTLPAPRGHEPALRARAAARAGPGAGAARRHAAGRGAARWAAGQRVERVGRLATGCSGRSRGRRLRPAAAARARSAGSTGGVLPGTPGSPRASSPAGRASIAGRRSSRLIASRTLGGDLEVGGVGRLAAEHARRQSSRRSAAAAGQRREVGAHVLVVGAVDADLRGDDRRRGAHGQPDRDAEPRALGVAAPAPGDRASVAFQKMRRTGCREGLLAPALRVLDLAAAARVGGEERRLGLQPVELPRDLARAGDLPPGDGERGDGGRGEAHGASARRARSRASGRPACRGSPSAPACGAQPSPDASRGSRRAWPRAHPSRPNRIWRSDRGHNPGHAAGGGRWQYADPPRGLRRRRAGRALALRDRGRARPPTSWRPGSPACSRCAGIELDADRRARSSPRWSRG